MPPSPAVASTFAAAAALWFRRKSRASHDDAAFEQCYGGAVLKIKVEDTKRSYVDCGIRVTVLPRGTAGRVSSPVRTPSSIYSPSLSRISTLNLGQAGLLGMCLCLTRRRRSRPSVMPLIRVSGPPRSLRSCLTNNQRAWSFTAVLDNFQCCRGEFNTQS